MRRWVRGTGWVADLTPRPCATCGALITPKIGKGRPLKYCETHAPPLRAYIRAWQVTNKEHVREYQRATLGYRPTREIVCRECGQPTKSFVDDRCTRCRVMIDKRKPDPVCPSCGSTFQRRGPMHVYCSRLCNPARGTGHYKSKRRATQRAGERIVPRLIFDRDGWVCRLCSKAVDPSLTYPHPDAASIDHIIPIKLGGPHTHANVQTAHWRCNMRKGATIQAA